MNNKTKELVKNDRGNDLIMHTTSTKPNEKILTKIRFILQMKHIKSKTLASEIKVR
jgi:hypothetical protein